MGRQTIHLTQLANAAFLSTRFSQIGRRAAGGFIEAVKHATSDRMVGSVWRAKVVWVIDRSGVAAASAGKGPSSAASVSAARSYSHGIGALLAAKCRGHGEILFIKVDSLTSFLNIPTKFPWGGGLHIDFVRDCRL